MPLIFYIILGFLGLIALVGGWYVWRSRWMRRAIRITTPNGIDEEEYIDLDGTKHYMCHRGHDRSHPVLLFLHGGPGASLVPFLHGFQRPWEELVTVVHWDQQGAGKTALANHPLDKINDISLEQTMLDLERVVQHIKEKYGKNRVFLMGYSWGTVLADAYIRLHPEDVISYFGITPLIDMQANESWAYEHMVDVLMSKKNSNDQTALFQLAPYPSEVFDEVMMHKLHTLRSLQMKYQQGKGSQARMLTLLFTSPYLTYEEYRSTQNPLFYQTQLPLLQHMYTSFRLTPEHANYEVPLYYFWGEQDRQNSPQLIANYFAAVHAPAKGDFPLPEGGHLPFLDDTIHFNESFVPLLKRLVEEHHS